MKINQAIRLLALTAGLCAPVAQAANGTWTNLAGGSWTNTANWSGGTVAGGAGFLANFSTLNLAANATVTLDGPKTIGNLSFSDTTATFFNWIVNTGSGGPLTLAVSSGSPTITITNGQATINAVISGTNGLTKAGAGILVLTAANLFSNNVTLTAGTLNINSDAALGAVSNAITFNGGTLQVPASTTVTLDAARSNICNSTFAARSFSFSARRRSISRCAHHSASLFALWTLKIWASNVTADVAAYCLCSSLIACLLR